MFYGTYVSLADNDVRVLRVDHVGEEFTAHEICALILLDEALIDLLGQTNFLREALFSEVAHSMCIGICEEVVDTMLSVVIFQVVHQLSSITLK